MSTHMLLHSHARFTYVPPAMTGGRLHKISPDLQKYQQIQKII